jgi:predicted nucleic-acid-binding protein
LVISLVVLCEFVWVASSAYGLSHREIADSIRLLMADPKVFCDREAVFLGLELLDSSGNFADGAMFMDTQRMGAVTFATFDRQAARLLVQRGHACHLLPNR